MSSPQELEDQMQQMVLVSILYSRGQHNRFHKHMAEFTSNHEVLGSSQNHWSLVNGFNVSGHNNRSDL